MRAQRLPQHGVEQMRGGVVTLGRQAMLGQHVRLESGVAPGFEQRAGIAVHLHAVDDALAFAIDVHQLGGDAAARDPTAIGHLPAGLRVAGRPVEHQLDRVLLGGSPAPQRETVRLQHVVAEEFGILPRAHLGPG